jgi:hypothetical protein
MTLLKRRMLFAFTVFGFVFCLTVVPLICNYTLKRSYENAFNISLNNKIQLMRHNKESVSISFDSAPYGITITPIGEQLYQNTLVGDSIFKLPNSDSVSIKGKYGLRIYRFRPVQYKILPE